LVKVGTQGAIVSRESGASGRKVRLWLGVATMIAGVFGATLAASAEDRSLYLYNLHTKERATIVFKRDGKYDSAGLSKLNTFLRDWRKNRPTKMDPKLFDLLWEVYRQGGSKEPINIVCGYRSPETNSMLRSRSKGVASNSQHTKGKAIDFYIPGVQLANLRAIGLRAGVGGVGYYPSSGSPFVHMDTGSVRHWPRMTRQQLVAVFPKGGTLHVPSDGKPLPNYAQALAAYKTRQAGAPIAVASIGPDEDESSAPASTASTSADTAVKVAAADIPLPRIAPDRDEASPTIVALIDEAADRAAPLSGIDRIITDADFDQGRFGAAEAADLMEVDFDATFEDHAPNAPVALANAMAGRDRGVKVASASASLPIAPTAIVATVDVTRPLRAEAMTTAVLRKSGDAQKPIPQIMAFASAAPEPEERATSLGVPIPQVNPTRAVAAAPAPAPATVEEERASAAYDRLPQAKLTLTALDTQGLRLWIATQSTREKRYAMLTMPDFGREPSLLAKPQAAFASGFTHTAYPGLRTDHFAGQLVQPPAIIDLTILARFAAAD
jgi:uncharacterized protein YcbK (DUF882 family)